MPKHRTDTRLPLAGGWGTAALTPRLGLRLCPGTQFVRDPQVSGEPALSKAMHFRDLRGTLLPPQLPPPEACGGGRKPRLTGGHEWPVPSSPSSSQWGRAAGPSRRPPPSPGQAGGVCFGSGGSSQATHAPSTSVRALSHTHPPVPAGPVQWGPQIHGEGAPRTWMRPLCLLFQGGVLSPAPREAAPTPPPWTGARSQVRVSLATRDVGGWGAAAQIKRPVPPWARPAVRRSRAVAATGYCGQSQPDPAHPGPSHHLPNGLGGTQNHPGPWWPSLVPGPVSP